MKDLERDPVLARLLPRFIENRRRDVAAIGELLEHEQFEQLVDMGHNLKGTGRSYGHDSITEIGRALEEAARARNRDEVSRQADALAAYLQSDRF
jgi:HPt (histidine-containing phosphotransfer) domain-containing protein